MTQENHNMQNSCDPLEELKIPLKANGVMRHVPALSQGWAEQRCFLHYKPPPKPGPDGSFPIGSKESWLERMDFLILDLTWLLELQQFRFWSQIIYGEKTLDVVLTFLHDAHPFYALDQFPEDVEMWKRFQKIHHLVFLVIVRLSTLKESETEYISPEYFGNMIYENYVFTIPMFLDICMFYGRDNRAEVEKLITAVFEVQPKYFEDLKKSVPFISKVMRFAEHKFGGRKLPEGELVKLTDRPTGNEDMSLQELKDLILHVLDTSINLSIFLDIFTPACTVFHQQSFEMKIVHFYENTVPQMYRKLSVLMDNDDTVHEYADLKSKLDMMRLEWLKVFRLCLATCINEMSMNVDTITEAIVKKNVDDYVGILTECLSEKVFIRDYHSAYPVDLDLDTMSQLCPEMDFMKCDFLLEAVLSNFDVPNKNDKLNILRRVSERIPNTLQGSNVMNGDAKAAVVRKVKGVELDSLITEVKDILPHLGDGFVEKCLEHYNYVSESVVNAVLEGTLPPDLQNVDPTLPKIPPDPDVEEADNCIQRLNIFDNDPFDIMTQDEIDTSKIHKGKRKSQYKNLNQLIDDKTHRSEFREMYTKFGLVDTEGSMYDDEYDDTYDHLDVSVGEEGDFERKPFVVPRILQTNEDSSSDEQSDREGPVEPSKPPRDEFVQNPEELRAKAEQRRQQLMQSRGKGWRSGPQPPKQRDVVGRPKGQGQDKQVVVNRDHKNVNKAARGNHNRRAGAQRKRQQGMMPF